MKLKKVAAKYSLRPQFGDFKLSTLEPRNTNELSEKLGAKFSNQFNLGKLSSG